MNSRLIAMPTDIEIRGAEKSINGGGGEAPGPNGFPAKFYYSYWHAIWSDVASDIKWFFSTGYLSPQQNETYVCLIPKVSVPWKVADYSKNSHSETTATISGNHLKDPVCFCIRLSHFR